MWKTKRWVLLLCAAGLVLAALSWWTLSRRSEGRVAEVVQNGVVIRRIDLDRVTQEYEFTVEWPEGGSNVVLVQPGRICVKDADCPDRVCVGMGWLEDQAMPIVCLPHRVIIRLAESNDAARDAVAR